MTRLAGRPLRVPAPRSRMGRGQGRGRSRVPTGMSSSRSDVPKEGGVAPASRPGGIVRPSVTSSGLAGSPAWVCVVVLDSARGRGTTLLAGPRGLCLGRPERRGPQRRAAAPRHAPRQPRLTPPARPEQLEHDLLQRLPRRRRGAGRGGRVLDQQRVDPPQRRVDLRARPRRGAATGSMTWRSIIASGRACPRTAARP